MAQKGFYWKHELAPRVCKGSWKFSAKTNPVKAQGTKNKNRLGSLKLWLEVSWPDVTSSSMGSFSQVRLVLLSLKFQTSSLIPRMSFLLHEKTNKTHIKCEKSHLCTQNSQMYLHRSICPSIYMQFITSLKGFFRRQQNLICKRNPSLEDEVSLLHPDPCLSHI